MKSTRLNYLSITAMGLAVLIGCQNSSNQEQAVVEEVPRSIPMEDFFRNPEKASYRISPSGEYFSFLAPYESRLNIFIQKVGEEAAQRITEVTERDIAGYLWANDNQLLYVKDVGGDENYQLFGVDRNGENHKALTAIEGVKTQLIDDLEEIEDEVIIGLNKRNREIFDPYRLNISTGEMEMIAENPGNITSWMTDHAGKLRLAIVTDGINQTIMCRETEGDAFVPVITTNFKESLDPMFFTFDNKDLFAISNIGRDKAALVKISAKDGSEIEEVYANGDVDVRYASYSKKRKVLTSAHFTTWKRQRHDLDEIMGKIYLDLEKKLEGYEVFVGSNNKAEDAFIVRTYSDKSLGAYYIYTTADQKLEKIADVSPWIDETEMAEMKPIEYTSRDGLTIHGYLTLPKGRKAKNLPVVINPHGGPWARDNWGYNSQVQFLANRGYAVLQMNFRGSTGYGRKFWEASFKQWGMKMQDDISDGVKWLIGEGIADPKRVAIYGGSYGGYATLAGMAFTPELYACGIDYVGVSNLFTFMKTIPPYWKPYLEMMYEMAGNPVEDSAQFVKTSPVFHAEKITSPLLVAQGAKDPRVNINESDQMVEALKERNIEVEYLVKENEGHGFRNEENRFEFYRAMEVFLAKHIGGDIEQVDKNQAIM